MEILLFGITRDIVGDRKIEVPPEESPETVADLKRWLCQKYERLNGLRSLAIAVENEYAEDSAVLMPGMEIALIPPVSGG